MNCTICGKPTRPGSALCVPCRAALKRARYESVLDVSPLAGNKPLPRATQSVSIGIDTLPASASPRAILGSRTTKLWMGAGLLVVASAVAVVLVESSANGTRGLAVTSRASLAQSAASDASTPKFGAQLASATTQATTRNGTTAASFEAGTAATPAPSATHPTSDPPAAAAEAQKPALNPRTTSPDAVRVAARASPAISAVDEENTPIDAFGPASPPPRRVETPAVVKPAPPADRWQLLADAIARCPDGNPFERATCEQRARAQYCENSWGFVPQCPAFAPIEHGQ